MAFAIHIQNPPFSKLKAKARSALNISDFQSVQRDFSFIVDQNIEASILVNAAKGADKSLIKDAYIFDQFINLSENAPKMQGKKSLAIAVHIQSSEKTLIDDEIENVSKKVIASIEKASGGVLRS
jgi:phenylalanyl-tRNA synthetase beta chain